MISLIKVHEHDWIEVSVFGEPFRSWMCGGCHEKIIAFDLSRDS